MSAPRKLAAEFIGAAMLAGAVIGSGVMGARLSDDVAVALLANTAATAAMLYVIITMFAPISGAHFNPAVTLALALRGEITAPMASAYVMAQIAGCTSGAVLAHAMFALPLLQEATQARAGAPHLLSEAVATFALVLTIILVSRTRPQAIAAAVALVIAAGYWWTASTSFANPAITLARALSDTFAGIRAADAPGFIAAQLGGAALATLAAAALGARAPARGAIVSQPPAAGEASR